MALIPADLSQQMLASTKNQTNGMKAMSDLGNAISQYIIQNAVVNFSYSGVDPVPKPVVIPLITGKIISMTISLVQVPGGMPQLNLLLGQGIMTGIYVPDPPFAGSTGTLIGFPPTTLTLSQATKREDAFLNMATTIVNNIKSFVPTVPCSGVYPPAVSGVATPLGII